VRERIRGKVDEHTLPVAKRRHANQRAHCFDVATGFADEPADVAVRKLHLDSDGSTTALNRFDDYFIGLFRE
jgi:hypothetical protein